MAEMGSAHCIGLPWRTRDWLDYFLAVNHFFFNSLLQTLTPVDPIRRKLGKNRGKQQNIAKMVGGEDGTMRWLGQTSPTIVRHICSIVFALISTVL